MSRVAAALNRLPWALVLLLCLTLGLAPFVPEPHVWEKVRMLVSGELVRMIDILDFLMHGAPWLLAMLKLLAMQVSPK